MQTTIVLHGKNLEWILNGLQRNLGETPVDVKKKADGVECAFEESSSVRKAVNKTVREYVVNFLEPEEIRKIINKGYSFFDPYERTNLVKAVQKTISDEDDIHGRLFAMRRNRIIEAVSESYFKEHNELNLEGFVPFRLAAYYGELEEAVEYNAEAFVVQKEYEEFILLLKTYLAAQPVSLKLLEIVVTENRGYIFYDISGRNITSKLSCEVFEGFEPEFDDLLINVLITKNPAKIVIHNRKFMKKEIADTLKLIFEKRCVFCEGCNLCKKNHSIKV